MALGAEPIPFGDGLEDRVEAGEVVAVEAAGALDHAAGGGGLAADLALWGNRAGERLLLCQGSGRA